MGEITTLSQGGEPILTVERRYRDFMAYIMLERHRRSGLLRRKMAACVQQFGCSCSRCSRRNQQGPSTKNRSCRFCSIWGRIYRLRLSTNDYYYTLTIRVLKREQYLSNICSLFLVLLISLKCTVVKKWNFFLRKKLIGKRIRNKMEALMEIVFTRLVMLFFMDRSVVR